ncbi:MAG: DUF4390 domain-containing protein [Methylococcales bacterium]|nr:DUF4390 domain-containing protein [Methylococcales bacterium]
MTKFLLKRLSVLGLLFGLFFQAVIANEFSTQIKSAKLQPYGQWHQLQITTDFHLSPMAVEALESSIPLLWCLKVKFERLGLVWNQNLFTKNYCYKVQYHALLKTYSVSHKETKYFHSLPSALNTLSMIDHIKIIKSSKIKADENYRLQVKWQFDREALPLPLRPLSYLDPQWNLSSDWYLWTSEP